MRRNLNGEREFSAETICEVIARYRGSGLSLAQFAREEGIPPGRLHYWIYMKGRAKGRRALERSVSAPVFQEVKVGVMLPGISGWAAEVSLPRGLAVRFSGGAAPQWIGAVVQALQAPC
jgi:hypothetical protein